MKTLLIELEAARPDLQWRRGMGGICDAVMVDGRRVQVWTEGEVYVIGIGREPSRRGYDLPELLTQATAPKPEPLVQRVDMGIVIGDPVGGGR